MSFVDIFIFLKGLLDEKGCILNTIYKCHFIFMFHFILFEKEWINIQMVTIFE